jgi:hypothetical protein
MESKPVFELHKMPEGFIVTSNQKDTVGYLPIVLTKFNELEQTADGDDVYHHIKNGSKIIIAQQDQIDFSALTEEQQKEIGWFDVEKYIDNLFKDEFEIAQEAMPAIWYDIKLKAIQTFQKAQELLSDRRFSLEDMFKVLDLMKHIAKTSSNLAVMEVEGRRLIESLSQKSWKVEIQHVCEGVKKEGESCTLNNKCTYPNCGKIKILKLC